MNFYDRWVLPPILDLVMQQAPLERYRREVVGAATGRVLEVGVGSGLNFPVYSKQVAFVFGIDPSRRLMALARRRAAPAGTLRVVGPGSAPAAEGGTGRGGASSHGLGAVAGAAARPVRERSDLE